MPLLPAAQDAFVSPSRVAAPPVWQVAEASTSPVSQESVQLVSVQARARTTRNGAATVAAVSPFGPGSPLGPRSPFEPASPYCPGSPLRP